jgi:heptosyltransferase III
LLRLLPQPEPVMTTLNLAPKQILIINVSRIGDTLLATPAIRAIAQHWPEAKLTVLGHPKRVEVLEHLPFIYRVGSIDKRSSLWRGRFGGDRFDLAFVYGNDRPLIDYALRTSSQVVAFAQMDDDLNRRLLHAVKPPTYQSMHAAKMHLLLAQALGVNNNDLQLAYQVSADEGVWAKTKIAADIGALQGPLIGLQVSSFPTKAYRNWPLDHFEALCRQLIDDNHEARFLIFGGSTDIELTTKLHQQLGNCSALYAGRLSLRQTAALMSQLDLYVGVDTGPTHIAGALSRPMVALYHCKHPSRCFAPPVGPTVIAIDHPALEGGDCHETSSLADIAVAQVLASCRNLLNKTGPNRYGTD